MENINKGIICVTGGTGYVASWLIMRLLQSGYFVNTTINNNLDQGASNFLMKLPNASQRLKIFNTNPEHSESFYPAIEGCNGVIIGHSVDFEDKYDEDTRIQRSIEGILDILKGCLERKTIERVIYTSSDATVCFNKEWPDVVDESWWSDVDFIKKLGPSGAFYCISKRLIEKAALDFAEKNGLDFVCVNHAWVFGPFVTPQCPLLVSRHLPMILKGTYVPIYFFTCYFGRSISTHIYKCVGNWTNIEYDSGVIPFVHVDDVARAHIFLLESPKVKGRYICSRLDSTSDELSRFLRATYPQYKIPTFDCLKVTTKAFKFPRLSSKKLLDAGFKYEYDLEDMYDGAIASCKQVGLL
ncbi:vestitone reductase-like [Capsicum chacoense]